MKATNKIPYTSTAYRGQRSTSSLNPDKYTFDSVSVLDPSSKKLLSWDSPYHGVHTLISELPLSYLQNSWEKCQKGINFYGEYFFQPLSISHYPRHFLKDIFYFFMIFSCIGLLVSSLVFSYFIMSFIFIATLMTSFLFAAGTKNKATYKLDRANGMIYLFKYRQVKTHLFSEAIPLLGSSSSKNNSLSLRFKDDEIVILSLGRGDIHKNHMVEFWEFLKAFMDVTLPLPDIPELEPLRPYDATTVKWDQENARPKDLYKNMSSETYKKLYERSSSYQQNFANGLPISFNRVQKIWTFVSSQDLGLEPDLWPIAEPIYCEPMPERLKPEKPKSHPKNRPKHGIHNRKKRSNTP